MLIHQPERAATARWARIAGSIEGEIPSRARVTLLQRYFLSKGKGVSLARAGTALQRRILLRRV